MLTNSFNNNKYHKEDRQKSKALNELKEFAN